MNDAPLHTKVRKSDWLHAARTTLIEAGEEKVKILTLAERLGISRSSFYWYFKSRDDLLKALLDDWMTTNTDVLIQQTQKPAPTITEAVCNFFLCFLSRTTFDNQLDFAVREWARRSEVVKGVVALSDERRLTALADMFLRYGYPPFEVQTRARALYYMQIGYNDADLRETLESRLQNVPLYLRIFTGQDAPADELNRFVKLVRPQD